MRTSNKSVTPTLAEVIQTLIDSNLVELHTCLPAKIVKYDSDTQTASVLPSLLRMYEDGTPLPWPVIPNVPVLFPKAVGGKAYIHVPLVPSDDVLLIVSERSIDNWKQTGAMSDPSDRRKFNISDAYAIPGASAGPFTFKPDDPQAIEIRNLLGMLQVKPTGEFKFKNDIVTIDANATGQIQIKNTAATVTITPTGTVTVDAPRVNLGSGASHPVGLGDVILARIAALELAYNTFVSTTFNLHTHIDSAPGSPTAPPLPIGIPLVPDPTPLGSITVKVST
jgi:hypothetical protein